MNTPLHIAAEKGNLETLIQLLDHFKVENNAKNVLGKTALHLAAEKGHIQLVLFISINFMYIIVTPNTSGYEAIIIYLVI